MRYEAWDLAKQPTKYPVSGKKRNISLGKSHFWMCGPEGGVTNFAKNVSIYTLVAKWSKSFKYANKNSKEWKFHIFFVIFFFLILKRTVRTSGSCKWSWRWCWRRYWGSQRSSDWTPGNLSCFLFSSLLWTNNINYIFLLQFEFEDFEKNCLMAVQSKAGGNLSNILYRWV